MKSLFGRAPKTKGQDYGPVDWYELLGEELNVTWGKIKRFEGEVSEMRFMRAQTCWLEGTRDDLRERRRSVLSMARSLISQRDATDTELYNLWPLIGVDSISPRLADLICQEYILPVTRTYSDKDDINSGFDDFYSKLGITELMNGAYRSALFTNSVLLYWDGQKFLSLTPDCFRIDADDRLWVCRREADGIFYDAWDEQYVTTYKSGERLHGRVPNPYATAGTFNGWPGVLLKLGKSLDTYGAGITEAAEINAWQNLITLLSSRVAFFQSFSIGIARNLQMKEGEKIGPGKFIVAKNPTGEAASTPDLIYATPQGKFLEMEEYKRKRVAAFERSTGIPAFLLDEGAGQPPTGAALQVLERALNDKRKAHQGSLRATETELAPFVAWLAKKLGRPALVLGRFDIQYSPPTTFSDPTQELAHDLTRAANGLVYPSELTQKYLGIVRGQTDQSAVEMLKANKAALSFLNPVPEKLPTPEAPKGPATQQPKVSP